MITYLEKRDVDEGRVEVDALEKEYLECIVVLELSLGPWVLKIGQPKSDSFIDLK